jgi:hypothetical protein
MRFTTGCEGGWRHELGLVTYSFIVGCLSAVRWATHLFAALGEVFTERPVF